MAVSSLLGCLFVQIYRVRQPVAFSDIKVTLYTFRSRQVQVALSNLTNDVLATRVFSQVVRLA